MKKRKTTKAWHTPKTQKGMGDFYGTGIKNPMGKAIDVFGFGTPKAKKAKPPKALA